MNKYFLCFLLVGILFLSSCSLVRGRTGIFDDSATKIDAKIEQILETIKNNDKKALKSLFSKQVLDETEDFDERLDYLFEFIQGEIESWKRTGGPVGNEIINDGHKTKNVCAWYNVNTDVEKYIFLIRECTTDTDNPDNVGLYMLNTIKAENKDILFDSPIIGSYKSD